MVDFKGGTMRLLALITLLLLSGCTVWRHPEKGVENSAAFKADVYECAFETKDFSRWRVEDMQNRCLQNRGWRRERR
jgi:hypothetical protein